MYRILLTAILSFFVTVVFSQGTVKKISIPKGQTAITLSGSVKGYGFTDYQLNCSKGQTLEVQLIAANPANYFNVLPPGSADVAIYNSSTEGNKYKVLLTESGVFTIRVYLMRNAARRNESSKFTLKVSVKGS
jgi:hypothetical protein